MMDDSSPRSEPRDNQLPDDSDEPESPKTVATGPPSGSDDQDSAQRMQTPGDPRKALYQPAVPSQPVPSPDPTGPEGSQPVPSQPAPEPPRQGRGCRRGCFGCLGIVVLLSCISVASVFALPPLLRGLGIGGQTARELYSGAPDPVAAAAVEEMFEDFGVEGVSVLVIPISGSEGQIAILTFDETASVGGSLADAVGSEIFFLAISELTRVNREGDLRIERTSIDFRDAEGNSTLAMTTSQDNLEALADGVIGQDQFLKGVEIDMRKTIQFLGLDQVLGGDVEGLLDGVTDEALGD